MKVAVLTKRWFGGKETEVYGFQSKKRGNESKKNGNVVSERSVLVIAIVLRDEVSVVEPRTVTGCLPLCGQTSSLEIIWVHSRYNLDV